MIPSDDSRLYWGDSDTEKWSMEGLLRAKESGKLINKLRSKAREMAKAHNLEIIILMVRE